MSEEKFNILFGNNLTHYMQQYNISQNELARRLGVSPTSVNNWCQGLKTPRMDKVDKICQFFGIRRVDLIAENTLSEGDILPQDEQALLAKYRSLNDTGKERLMEQADLLAASPAYTDAGSQQQVG